jgi:hypothetical protein
MQWSNAVSDCAMSFGAALPPAVSLSTGSISFANQTVGVSSSARNVTVTNSGAGALTITDITLTGTNPPDFVQTNNCGSSLGAGSSCTITLTFKPAATGSRTASVAISDNATGSPQTISLTGTGIPGTTTPPGGTTANTYHVFPQVADGTFTDGSYFQSTVVVINVSPSTANCTLQLHGITVNGQNQISFSVVNGYLYMTPGNTHVLQTGYASLQCSVNVEAQLLYTLYAPNGTKISEATVFSSPAASSLRIVADYRGGARLGLAIANESVLNQAYTIVVRNIDGSVLGSPTVTVPSGQNHASFIDELIDLPANYYGVVDIVATVGMVNAIGLRFTGSIFTTVPAAEMSALSPAANTYHVFPQVADGTFSDGSYFESTVAVTNVSSGTASCTLQLHGVTVNGQSEITFNVTGVYLFSTPGSTQALQTGYASLECSSNVEAQLLYSFYTGSGTKISEATVFSSPGSSTLRVLADYRVGNRLGLAIANDSVVSQNYTIVVHNIDGAVLGSSILSVAAGQNHAAFVDELITLPANYYGLVDVVASGSSANAIGLSFTGNLFTTIPAIVMGP